jgi:hypothetical protein
LYNKAVVQQGRCTSGPLYNMYGLISKLRAVVQ